LKDGDEPDHSKREGDKKKMKGGGYAELNTGKSYDIHDISPTKNSYAIFLSFLVKHATSWGNIPNKVFFVINYT
jgi:hypothetical protein